MTVGKRRKLVTRKYVRKHVVPLKDVGNYMSNVCFNIAQTDGVPEGVKKLAKKWQVEWDKAVRKMPSWMVCHQYDPQ